MTSNYGVKALNTKKKKNNLTTAENERTHKIPSCAPLKAKAC